MDTEYGLSVFENHAKLLRDSAISVEVAKARKYRSVDTKAQLERSGFDVKQRRVPGLLIPVHTVHGEEGYLYQYRPDSPRKNSKGKPIKYETPAAAAMRVDVPPAVQPLLGDPTVDLWITEGVRKADAAVTAGLCCIDFLGVWNWRGKNDFGGKAVLADLGNIAWNERNVTICFDSDVMEKKSVHAALVALTAELKNRGAYIEYCYLPDGPNGEKVGLDDWLAAGHDVSLLAGFCDAELRGFVEMDTAGNGLPVLLTTGRPLLEVADEVVDLLVTANNPPKLFQRSGEFAQLKHLSDRPIIESVDMARLRNRVCEVCQPMRRNGQGGLTHIHTMNELMTAVAVRPLDQIPEIDGITEIPVLRTDGTVHSEPGYDEGSRLYYIPNGDKAVTVPETPTKEQVDEAVLLLAELLVDFPFEEAADLANAVGLILTPIVRPAVASPVPLALIDAPEPGTGKGLLAEVVALITTGRSAVISTLAKSDEENRKLITAVLTDGPSIVLFDNVERQIRSAALAALFTSTTWSGRILGKSETVELPNRATWIATGNNMTVGGDLARRCYRIRLDAKQARPWARSEFRHADLAGWVLENRSELVAACLTLARSWYVAGCPAGDVPMLGSFTPWARIVGGILEHVGIEGFLGNLQKLHEEADSEAQEWESFLTAWSEKWSDLPRTTAEVAEEIQDAESPLRDAVPANLLDALDRRSFRGVLGRALQLRAGRHYGWGGLHLVRLPVNRRKVATWSVGTGDFDPSGLDGQLDLSAGSGDETRGVRGESSNSLPAGQTAYTSAVEAPAGSGASFFNLKETFFGVNRNRLTTKSPPPTAELNSRTPRAPVESPGEGVTPRGESDPLPAPIDSEGEIDLTKSSDADLLTGETFSDGVEEW